MIKSGRFILFDSRVLTAAILFAAALSGCGPARLLDAPAQLPKELDGRRLWHTPSGYIYAADEAVAGETDRWITELDRHLKRTYQRELGKGLVIVIDDGEKPFVKSFDEMVRLQRQTAIAAGVKSHEMPDVDAQRQKMEAGGMSEDLACRITPFELDGTVRAAGGLPHGLPDDAHWSISCPSQGLMEKAMWEFGPKALEKKKGKAFAVATAWAWPLAFAEAAKGFQLGRDVLVFELWAIQQSQWDQELRNQEISKYTEERAFIISPTLALALKVAKGDSKGAADASTDSDPDDDAYDDAEPSEQSTSPNDPDPGSNR